jgi:hypothetical protein
MARTELRGYGKTESQRNHAEKEERSRAAGAETEMLIQHLPLLSSKRLVLASASPRRRQLLHSLVRAPTLSLSLFLSLFLQPSWKQVETVLGLGFRI